MPESELQPLRFSLVYLMLVNRSVSKRISTVVLNKQDKTALAQNSTIFTSKIESDLEALTNNRPVKVESGAQTDEDAIANGFNQAIVDYKQSKSEFYVIQRVLSLAI